MRSNRRPRWPERLPETLPRPSTSAAVASTLSVLRNDSLYNNTVVIAWLAWFSEQFSTTLLLLPVLMAAPRLKQLLRMQVRWRLKGCLPLLALLLSLAFSVYIGGPGAIAFPIPANDDVRVAPPGNRIVICPGKLTCSRVPTLSR